MSQIVADRVQETTTTTGTGALTLGGAVTGYRRFSDVMGLNDVFYYCVAGGAEWEVGLGQLTGFSTLTRVKVLSSSNSNAAVSFSAGTKNAFLTTPAAAAPGPATSAAAVLAAYQNLR